MSLSLSAIAETPLSTASTPPATEKKVPGRRQVTAVADSKAEPEAR